MPRRLMYVTNLDCSKTLFCVVVNGRRRQFTRIPIPNRNNTQRNIKIAQQRRRSARPLFYYHRRSTVHALSMFASLLLFPSKWLSVYFYDFIPRSALDIIAQTMRGEKWDEKNPIQKSISLSSSLHLSVCCSAFTYGHCSRI